jgi:hypothetical protein
LVEVISILAGAALPLAAAYGIGRLAWRFRAPHWTLALASGSALLSLAVFLLLSAGWAHPAALLVLCLACCATLALHAKPIGFRIRPSWAAILFVPFAVLYFVHAMAPEIQPDAVTYHLGLVAEWSRTHGFAARIGFYELLPLGLETLFLPAFQVGAHSAAKLVHFAYLAATLPLMAHIARRLELPMGAGWTGGALYALSPVVAIAGTSAYNDAALVFFTLAAFASMIEFEKEGSNLLLAHAGLAAGFCYSIKITGILAPAIGLVWLLTKRRWRGAALFSCASALMILPWVIRALLLTGNPLAPLGNRIFANDSFHAFNEDILARNLAHYGASNWWEIPWSLTVDGFALQGLIGPVFLLAPLALLALRKPQGRLLLALAALFLIPWTRNLGARFAMPSLALLSLAFASVLPRPAMLGLVILQGVLAWPAVTSLYSNPNSWRPRGFPWRAALRIEPESEYLAKAASEIGIARMVDRHVARGEQVLDLYALPYAYASVVPVGPLPSARFDNLAATLERASTRYPESMLELRCRWPVEFIRAVRVRLERPQTPTWSVAEIEPLRDGSPVPPARNWFVNAWPLPGDAWLAADGNMATRWRTWDRAQAGNFCQISFDRPIPLDGVAVFLPGGAERGSVTVFVQTLDRRWRLASEDAAYLVPPANLFRRAATQALRSQGIQWLVARVGGEGHGQIGAAMAMAPQAWGVEVVETTDGVALFRVK